MLIYDILAVVFILGSVLPLIQHQHWMFRVWEFGRIQLLLLQLLTFIIGVLFFSSLETFYIITAVLLGLAIAQNIYILVPYTFLYGRTKKADVTQGSQSISILSCNVYQFNTAYDRLIHLVQEVKPDILLTMESNQAWDDALSVLETEYTHYKKVALENTYGIHFYTKLDVKSVQVHYFVSDDLPSIEARIQLENTKQFTFFGVHPPPPSPTEEDTSRERDGELLALGKKVLDTKGPVIVVGDFNNVAWAKSSVLFRKTSKLIDPRIGRGFVSTYHAKYKVLRFPIDLCFHSPDIFIQDFRTLHNVGSDHLPLYCNFFLNETEEAQEDQVETLDEAEAEDVEEMIEDGEAEDGDRPTVATE
ncbi:endonuclease/exonuclease/phosphatase family protein [Formosa sediminum]|uniref:Endonuclease/exonuclease/phosphatase family protein n=1 Tax=Formosa sediminum TaxID=2594004 RepID=A0A516GSI2_9FLAO|nr:endonuclease/exonuclease/phosphatase family protein [Formosa sediminum]QDO94473.1 endonuclease/exonuclease/phosphatase family protein [Formosa sediminum]